jgi:hypothetical protein
MIALGRVMMGTEEGRADSVVKELTGPLATEDLWSSVMRMGGVMPDATRLPR